MTALLVAGLLAVWPQTSTAYCLRGTMADGTYTRAGSVAHNGYRLGTRVTVWPSPTGSKRWVVRDRIGWGTQLDFWLPSCSWARQWGRRTVNVRKGWPRRRHLIGTWRESRRRIAPARIARGSVVNVKGYGATVVGALCHVER